MLALYTVFVNNTAKILLSRRKGCLDEGLQTFKSADLSQTISDLSCKANKSVTYIPTSVSHLYDTNIQTPSKIFHYLCLTNAMLMKCIHASHFYHTH